MKTRRYPAYKAGGVAWLGEIPAGWEICSFKYRCRITEGQIDPRHEDASDLPLIAPNHIEQGTGRLLDVESAASQGAISGKYPVSANQLLYSKIRPALNKVCISPVDALCSADMYPIWPSKKLHRQFLLYWMLSPPFVRLMVNESMRVAMPKVNRETLGASPLIVPPLSDQRAIADWLDAHTARLDELVNKKRALMERLKEKRAALITRAVTRGLNPDAPLKDSGVPWLGQVPAHWAIKRFRDLFSMCGGATPDTEEPSYWDGGIPWVTPKDMKRWEIDSSIDTVSEEALRSGRVSLIDAPVILIVVRGMILAHSFPTAVTTCRITVNQDMKALTVKAQGNARYFGRQLDALTDPILGLTVDVAGHGTKALSIPDLRKFSLLVPPLEEQSKIAAWLDERLANLDRLVERAESAIERLSEYRAALITAAVTGKIDVRAACATLAAT